jgi:hypothetical protein
MSKNRIDDYKISDKVNLDEILKEIAEPSFSFPKYSTQIINLANQNAQGTRPKNVGQLSDLIHEISEKSLNSWQTWYLENYPDSIDNATEKIFVMIENFKETIKQIDKEMVKDWVKDLILIKTAEGLIYQEVILKKIAEKEGKSWRLAKKEEESKNIDGFIGDKPIQIKPLSYFSKDSLNEKIDVEIIYYQKTVKYLNIFRKQ